MNKIHFKFKSKQTKPHKKEQQQKVFFDTNSKTTLNPLWPTAFASQSPVPRHFLVPTRWTAAHSHPSAKQSPGAGHCAAGMRNSACDNSMQCAVPLPTFHRWGNWGARLGIVSRDHRANKCWSQNSNGVDSKASAAAFIPHTFFQVIAHVSFAVPPPLRRLRKQSSQKRRATLHPLQPLPLHLPGRNLSTEDTSSESELD